MSKYRPEMNTLKCPAKAADKFEAWLREELHARANLKRTDGAKGSIFTFWPTRGEYLIIAMLLKIKAEEFMNEKTIQSG
jgi:hypothetical protein